jgi:acetyl esterase/lipase
MRRRLMLTTASALLCAVLSAEAAHANIPPPVTKANTVRLPAYGNIPDGTLTTKLTYQQTTASAAASTGNTIGLGKGAVFTLTTCLAYHLQGAPPVSSCADRSVDTRANTATVYTYAPSVTLSGQRPTGPAAWGYFTAYSQILMQYNGATSFAANTWPDDGLQGAGLPVAAQAATAATLPPNATVTLQDLAYNGQINTGQADSICRPQPKAANGSALPPGVVSSHPGFAGAPAYYEVGLPTGAYAGQAPRGAMLVIHGGGWVTIGTGAVQAYGRAEADRWRARGFETVNFTYRGCGQSIADATWFYDRARARFGASAKICATGISAGGHLALMLAATRPDVYCVDSQAGPTDLRVIQDQLAYDPATGTLSQTWGGRWAHNIGAAAFGEENLAAASPAASATGPLRNTRLLQGFSADDYLVPWAQATTLGDAVLAANAAAYVDDDRLAPGTEVAFAHGRTTAAALADYYAREVQLVAPILGSTIPLNLR